MVIDTSAVVAALTEDDGPVFVSAMERAASLSISTVNAYETRLVFGDVPLRRLRLARPSSPALPILSPAAG